MVQAVFYRYVDDHERRLIDQNKRIEPAPGQVTPDRYDTGAEAQTFLALSYLPTYRVGPIPADEVPDFDHIPLRVTGAANGQPGGGLEAATTQTLHLFDIMAI